MLNISREGVITLTRGDSFVAPLFINKGTDLEPMRYIVTENDTVYLGVMEHNQTFENAIIKKVFTNADLNDNGDVVVSLTPQETEFLLPGTYYYSIKLKTDLNSVQDEYQVQTVIPEKQLILKR